jgi:hypothetical protein
MKTKITGLALILIHIIGCHAQDTPGDLNWLGQYNVIWTSQSNNSSESMPVSGGDIGLNVWVENNELFFYMGRAGYRDENGAILKPGRVRINIHPNPFENGTFRQELKLQEGYVLITGELPDGKPVEIKTWIEVSRPIVHVDITSDEPVEVAATYESWRTRNIELPAGSKHDQRSMCMGNYTAYQGQVFVYKDEIQATEKDVRFFHRVDNSLDCFDFQVKQQGLEPVRGELVNPLENLVWGGALVADNFVLNGETDGTYAETPFRGWRYKSKKSAKSHRIRVCLHIDQVEDQNTWNNDLQKLIDLSAETDKKSWKENQEWWDEFWDRSHIVINSGRGESDNGWRIGRNYQLFRYMLASNASGREPSLFNGGLFTTDPLFINGKSGQGYTPDHRQWGAALTAQNQRLLVWPLLKTGDFDFIPTGVSFYLNSLPNTMARVKHYWNHDGCCYAELISITGLPGAALYGWDHPGGRSRLHIEEVGIQTNPNTMYLYESQLEYAWMMLQYCQFSGADLAPYLNFIEQSVIFYDEHYRFRCKQLTGKELDDNGKLVIYPSNTLEKHTDARNPTSVVAGLKRVLTELLYLPDKYSSDEKRERWREILNRLPEMPTGNNEQYGGQYLKPSEKHDPRSWHMPEMYPLYPYQLYGIGLHDLELMENTFTATGPQRKKYTTWQQANIHSARLGQTELTQELNSKKMDNGPYRFPVFWPETIDWAPDHNWGGSGMIGMQEMILQTHHSLDEVKNGLPGKIRVLPAWPTEWDVDFKLHAPLQSTVEGDFTQGELTHVSVSPESRQEDLEINPLIQ